MVLGFLQPAPAVQHRALEEIPLGVAALARDAVQKLLCVGNAPSHNQIAHVPKAGPAVAAHRVIAVSPALVAIAAATLALGCNGVVGLVDLLHLLVGQLLQGAVGILVRVVLFGKLPVSLFHFLVCG